MKVENNTTKWAEMLRARSKGQTMTVVAVLLGLGVLIGLVAIAVDGGGALLQRRVQQNAADAGALAGIDLMASNLAASCNPAPCHPTYLTTNAILLDTVAELVQANRGGTIGGDDSNYSMSVEYHYMAGTPGDYAPCSAPCYHPVPTAGNPFIPEFVDGLRVTSRINNPTTFARALSIPLTDLGVSAVAASRVNPTCAPEIIGEGNGAPPPFTRFRAAIEHEINDPNLGNSLCHPFEFWSSSGDFGGNWKNLVSFNTNTFAPYNSQGTDITMQLMTDFDYRHGPLTISSTNGLTNYQHCCIAETLQPCFDPAPFGCADMRGSQQDTGSPVHQDIGNWLFWLWGGRLSLTSVYPIETNTRYPSNAANHGGTIGTLQERQGDWAELYNGNFGQNVQEAVFDSSTLFGVMTPPGLPAEEGGLNWGLVLTRTIYLWGESEEIVASGSMSSTQKFDQWTEELPCDPPSPGCTQIVEHDAWMDVNLIGTYPNYTLQGVQGNDQVRVRFTRAMPFLFFANLQGNHGADSVDPANDACDLPSPGSSAWGILPSLVVPPPPGGGGECGGWSPGGGVYKSQIPPEDP